MSDELRMVHMKMPEYLIDEVKNSVACHNAKVGIVEWTLSGWIRQAVREALAAEKVRGKAKGKESFVCAICQNTFPMKELSHYLQLLGGIREYHCRRCQGAALVI